MTTKTTRFEVAVQCVIKVPLVAIAEAIETFISTDYSAFWCRYLGVRNEPEPDAYRELVPGSALEDVDGDAVVPLIKGGSLRFAELVDEECVTITRYLDMEAIAVALPALSERCPHAFARLVAGDCDSEDADLFMQIALLGDIVYG